MRHINRVYYADYVPVAYEKSVCAVLVAPTREKAAALLVRRLKAEKLWTGVILESAITQYINTVPVSSQGTKFLCMTG